MRPNKIIYYLDVAETIAKRSTCLRRKYGAIIVKNDEIIATGYNGSPRGVINCSDCKICERELLNVPPGTQYELCRSVHAEQNAIISASRNEMIDATMYLVGLEKDGSITKYNKPCKICERMIINAGIKRVYLKKPDGGYDIINVDQMIKNMCKEISERIKDLNIRKG